MAVLSIVKPLSKNPCSNHRYCSCDIVCGKVGTSCTLVGSGGGSCGSNKTYGPVVNFCTAVKKDCVGYESTIRCKAFQEGCIGNQTMYAYECIGYRGVNAAKKYPFYEAVSKKQISAKVILDILSALLNEIKVRKTHLYYNDMKSYDEATITAKDEILVKQYNTIVDMLREIQQDYEIQTDYSQSEPLTTWKVQSTELKAGILIEPSPIKSIQNDLNSAYKDCICYSDCPKYGLWKYQYCTCNSVCGCWYWG